MQVATSPIMMDFGSRWWLDCSWVKEAVGATEDESSVGVRPSFDITLLMKLQLPRRSPPKCDSKRAKIRNARVGE